VQGPDVESAVKVIAENGVSAFERDHDGAGVFLAAGRDMAVAGLMRKLPAVIRGRSRFGYAPVAFLALRGRPERFGFSVTASEVAATFDAGFLRGWPRPKLFASAERASE
jgi:hypothetical protein